MKESVRRLRHTAPHFDNISGKCGGGSKTPRQLVTAHSGTPFQAMAGKNAGRADTPSPDPVTSAPAAAGSVTESEAAEGIVEVAETLPAARNTQQETEQEQTQQGDQVRKEGKATQAGAGAAEIENASVSMNIANTSELDYNSRPKPKEGEGSIIEQNTPAGVQRNEATERGLQQGKDCLLNIAGPMCSPDLIDRKSVV